MTYMVPIGLCGGGIAILSNSRPGDKTFVLRSVVSSRDVDLRKIIINWLLLKRFAFHLLGDACLELDLENFPALSPGINESMSDFALLENIYFQRD